MCKKNVSTASGSLFTSAWKPVDEFKFSLVDHEGRASGLKKRRPGFHVNIEAEPISFKLILLGGGPQTGTANGTREAGLSVFAHTEGEVQRHTAHLHSFVIPQETKCSEHKVVTESPKGALCLHIECKKEGRRAGNGC